MREKSGWVIYKTELTNIKGETRYLRVGIDEFGSISTAYPINRDYVNSLIKDNNELGLYLL